jgi:hypothetical protein
LHGCQLADRAEAATKRPAGFRWQVVQRFFPGRRFASQTKKQLVIQIACRQSSWAQTLRQAAANATRKTSAGIALTEQTHAARIALAGCMVVALALSLSVPPFFAIGKALASGRFNVGRETLRAYSILMRNREQPCPTKI